MLDAESVTWLALSAQRQALEHRGGLDNLPPGIQVRISPDERELLRILARARSAGKKQRFNAKKTPEDVHFEGLLGEYAASKVLGTPIDTRILPKGDGGIDLQLPTGETVSVRYRASRGWDFALNSTRLAEFKTDIAILVYPGLDTFPGDDDPLLEVAGWCTRDEFKARCKPASFGYGQRLVISPRDMNPIQSLMYAQNEARAFQALIQADIFST